MHVWRQTHKKNKAIWAAALKVEQLGTLLAKYWMAAANQFWEIRTQLITSISGNADQNFEVVCAWQRCNPMTITHYTVFKAILKQWWSVSLVKEISPQYLLLFTGIRLCCLDSLVFLSSLKVSEMSKMSLNANTCSVHSKWEKMFSNVEKIV